VKVDPTLLAPIRSFLLCETPDEWVSKAKQTENLSVLIRDHMLCELKAAQSAMFLIRRYAVNKDSASALLEWLKPYEDFAYRHTGDWKVLDKVKLKKAMVLKSDSQYAQDLVDKMVMLIREELHHFYQVLEVMDEYGIKFENINSSRYAKGLLKHVKTHEPDSLIDKLICGAYIEARSCERFAKIAPHLDERLGSFYISLLRSEARHFQDYLKLAGEIAAADISNRVAFFGEIEADLVVSDDPDFKFHSGKPV
jgi:tRNA-(ms[2]io[6]A)-hydroxylase